jgi:ribosome biogenesis protein ALB1
MQSTETLSNTGSVIPTLILVHHTMPSRNSINKPKDTINQAKKRASLAKKRAERIRKGLVAPSRSSESSTSGLPKSTSLALYTGGKQAGRLTTQTLSNKRLKKIERNKKYVAKRKEQLMIDVQAKAEEMDVDGQEEEKPNSKINSVKDALWSVIEDRATSEFTVDSTSEGTTLGGPSF